MRRPSIGELLVEADFGRTNLSPPALLLASNYRRIVAVLVTGLALFHIPLTGAPLFLLVVALTSYLISSVVRSRFLVHLRDRFYRPEIQFARAQLEIVGVTGLLAILALYGSTGVLWLLYLPALFRVSFYHRQRVYALVVLEVALAITALHLFELRHSDLQFIVLVAEIGSRVFGVLLPAFLIHYLARAYRTEQAGVRVRDRIVHDLLQHSLLETDGVALWGEIRKACSIAVNASTSDLYLYHREEEQLQQVEQSQDGYRLGRKINVTDDHIAARVARGQHVVEKVDVESQVCLAAPIYGQVDKSGPPLAVVVVHFTVKTDRERCAAFLFLIDLLHHIAPICTYASLRQQFLLLGWIDSGEVHQLDLNGVLDIVLDTLCDKLGFEFATISLVDDDQQEIRTVRGSKNVPPGWVQDAHHPLDSHDIQADVVRTGKTEIISNWDDRFDQEIWEKYNHADLVRVWVPLSQIGTIEAGFSKDRRSHIPPLLIEILKRYARDVTVAVQNALLFERERRHAAALARLPEISYDLQTNPRQYNETFLLAEIAQAALSVLGATNVMLYPLEWRDPLKQYPRRFAPPISAGLITGHEPLRLPNGDDNIVSHIAQARELYFQPDAQSDPLLVGDNADKAAGKQNLASTRRTFTVRQDIRSFAGVPLLARGELMGVLCVNYRERHQFSPHDRQVIKLFAQQAAAVIAGGQFVRAQERRRLEDDLHDSVKSTLRGLILLSREAANAMEADVHLASEYLHELRRAAWAILADINIILNDLSPSGYEGQALGRLLEEELRRLVGHDQSKITCELDENLPTLPMKLTRILLCLIREAVINALEHANAQGIHVAVRRADDRLHLIVGDNGRGFDVTTKGGQEHRGLEIMHKRAREIGGTMSLQSTVGEGTTVYIDLPLTEEADGSD